ncbi:MAG: Fe-S cluster assembly protein SufD [Alphaproteobacteria bacterium]|nr:Fe-S cluster assembly protein SufD [Alphaproteobacteria bacterium]
MSALAEIQPYIEAFKARAQAGEPDWLWHRREGAMQRFAELGFPTRKQEAWRFTDLRPLQRVAFPPAIAVAQATTDDIALWRFKGETYRIVLVDGAFVPALSAIDDLPTGAWLASTAQTLREWPELLDPAVRETDTVGAQPFAALNAALFTDGFVLALQPGVALDRTIEVIHLGRAANRSSQLRNVILLGPNSRATVIESYAGTGAYWTNAVGVIGVGAGAALRHVKLQDEDTAAIHLGQHRVDLGCNARYESFTLSLGGRLARNETHLKLDGEGAACGLFGATLLRGEQEGTIATVVDHAAPGCTTREYFKSVADDRAHGVFLGTIGVRPQAQKTDANQLSKNLLLSRRAAVDTKPELEILADDVKCSHGATVGDLDETALFYLESRGITVAEARRILIEAFAAEVIERLEDDADLRAHLGRHVARWLAAGDSR